MTDKIHQALDKHFQKHRLVFWYDPDGGRREVFSSFPGKGVQKVTAENNEFALKYRILRQEPNKKFLIYIPQARPADEENWFLDLILSHFVFVTDEVVWIMQDLELDPSLENVVAEHTSFFDNKRERLEPLRTVLTKHDGKLSPEDLRLSMTAVLLGDTKADREESPDLNNLLFRLFSSLALPDGERSDYMERLRRYGLDDFFWKLVEKNYGYSDENPGLEAFLAALFYKSLECTVDPSAGGEARRAFTFIDQWRNSIKHVEAYEELSEKYSRELEVRHHLQEKKIEELYGIDLFKEADRIIVHKLAERAAAGTINPQEALQRITERRGTYWVKSEADRRVSQAYDCLAAYFRFILELTERESYPKNPGDFWTAYYSSLYKIDQEYRLFLEKLLSISQRDLLHDLMQNVERSYVNDFLAGLFTAWHEVVSDFDAFSVGDIPRQIDFFKRYVRPYLQGGKVVFVIISDALRYEIGAELALDLERRNRIQVEIEALAAAVPTYTQVGMAALLPHKSLGIDSKTCNAVVDGKQIQGLEGRSSVLENAVEKIGDGLKARALDARTFMNLSQFQQEEEIRGLDCVYFYSNHIDAIGDSPRSELSLPDAVRREIDFLSSLVRKILNLNRTHILITADHGFLYQYGEVETSDFMTLPESVGEFHRDRRFLLGRNLPEDPRLLRVSAENAGLEGDFDIALVKGSTRIRKAGGGSRYVHGGISPHELCIPLLKIRKIREDDVRPVHFVVLTRSTEITTNSISLKFLQTDPVGAKVLSRRVMARFESEDGRTVLSNQRDLVFESEDENEQNRTVTANFVFNPEAARFNNQRIYLSFYESKMGVVIPVEERKSFRFRTAFTTDF